MPSPVIKTTVARRGLPARCLAGILVGSLALAAVYLSGCHEGRRGVSAREARAYPPEPQIPRVIALGTLRGSPAPTQGRVDLSMFLFGVEPPPPLTIANPTGLAAGDDCLLICDNALSTVFRWDAAAKEVSEERFRPALEHPIAIDITPSGDRLICDRGVVVRSDAGGKVSVEYTIDSEAFKPAGVLAVGQEVWVANLTANRIEIFDEASGQHLRSIGGAGRDAGQFAMPRGLARTPDGDVCIVDMLNNRVQVLDSGGNWLRNIGRPGSAAGCFGRPKDVAIGPDGTVFVTDASSQRVHAFAADGEPLMAFGEPGSGAGELTLPSGIAVSAVAPRTEHELPAGFSAAYYVLVAEQLNRPGVRVYAWLGNYEPDASAPAPAAVALRPGAAEGPAGPHWDADSCAACHEEDDDERPLPIASDDVAELCLDCHEGHDEGPFVHLVDGEADAEGIRIPTGWPLVDGELGCLTCHDIKQQCSTAARRGAATAKLLRRHDPGQADNLCAACHVEPGWSESPHRQLSPDGQPDAESCLVCHEDEPTVPGDGVRRFEAQLRDVSGSCLNCHSRHWDYFPAQHVDRLVPPEVGRSETLPLADGRIACYTCHNPHQVGLFPSGSELAAWAASAPEAALYLRADRPALCLECHEK